VFADDRTAGVAGEIDDGVGDVADDTPRSEPKDAAFERIGDREVPLTLEGRRVACPIALVSRSRPIVHSMRIIILLSE
jgi:hypothetical protein